MELGYVGRSPMKPCNIEVYSPTSIISLEAGSDFGSVYPPGKVHILHIITHQIGKRKYHFETYLGWGYVSCQEGTHMFA